MRAKIRNKHNGRVYRVEASLVASDGGKQRYWIRVLDTGPDVWGRARSGVGTGPVIDQGWQEDLVQRGWEVPDVPQQPDVRGAELSRIASKLKKEDRALTVADQLLG